MHGIMPPLGVMYIASYLEREGHDVRILDAYGKRLDPLRAAEAILALEPDVVGLAASTANYLSTKETAAALKSKTKAPIVFGGIHATALPEMSLRSGQFDYVILGEGENSMANLLEAIDNGRKPEFPGVAYLDNDQFVSFEPELMDLNRLPVKAWHLVDTSDYVPSPAGHRLRPAISTITARGCPGHCIYCALNHIFKHAVRLDPLENVRTELEYLKERGIRDINFWDSVFTWDRQRTIELCGILKEFGFKWNITTRVDTVDPELLEIMSDSGCYMIGYGVESSSEESLRRLGRAELNLQRVEQATRDTLKAGIHLKTYVMMGHPWEKKEDIEATFQFAKKLKAEFVSFCITKPYPGTALYRKAGKKWRDEDFEDFHHYSGHNAICEAISGEQLEKMSSMFYIRYYLRPGYIWETGKMIRSFTDVTHLFRSFGEVFLGF